MLQCTCTCRCGYSTHNIPYLVSRNLLEEDTTRIVTSAPCTPECLRNVLTRSSRNVPNLVDGSP